MRTTLILSTLFAVTLVSGAALAEKPHAAIDRLRARGDVVDKSYRSAERHAVSHAPQQVSGGARPSFDRAASRVSCSDTGADCPTKHRDARAAGVEASAAEKGRASRAPALLDKVLGSDRTSFNEAGEDQGMSSRAAKRAWSHAAPGATGGASSAGATVPLAHQQQHARTEDQASTNRMACNEGDQCMMSSKAVKKEWAYESIKKGTWQGPEAKKPSGAERAIAEMKSAKSDSAKRAHP